MNVSTFSESLIWGKPAYERIARLQQEICACQAQTLRINVNLTGKKTGLSFIFLLACLSYCAAEQEKRLDLIVDQRTFHLMQHIQVPGTRIGGEKTLAKATRCCFVSERYMAELPCAD